MRFFVALLLAAPALFPCSCGEDLPACERFPHADAVFTATVVEGDKDAAGPGDRHALYLVHVDEIFRGIPPAQTELFLSPFNYTSCTEPLTVGRQYLFYVRALGPRDAAAFYSAYHPSQIKMPARWASKQNLPVFVTSSCGSSRFGERADAHLAWLRSASRETPPTRVYGTTFQHHSPWALPGENVPLANATVNLRGEEFERIIQSGPEGEYAFENVPPGKYHLWAERTPWTPSRRMPIDVRPGGCVFANPRLESQGSLQGTLRLHNGSPAANIRLELVRILPGGALAENRSLWANTDRQGRFRFTKVPAGKFALGVNLIPTPWRKQTWPPVFYPGALSLGQARLLDLTVNAAVSDLDFALPLL